MYDIGKKFLSLSASLSAFSFCGAQTMVLALYPILSSTLHLGLSTLISCFSLGSFMFLVGSPYWSNKSDSWGRSKVLTLGTLALLFAFASLVFLVLGAFSSANFNLIVLIISRVIYGLVASSIIPAAQALQADIAGQEQATKAMMIHSMSMSLGRVAGVALIVIFHEHYKIVLLAYLIFIISVFLLNFLVQAETHERAEDLCSQHCLLSWKSESLNIKWIIAIAFLFTCFFEALFSSLAGTIKNLFLLDDLSSTLVGAKILLGMSIGVFFVQAMSKSLVKGPGAWKMGLAVGVTALVAGSFYLSQVKSLFDLGLALALCVVGVGILPPFYLSFLRSAGSTTHYGKRAGIIGSVHTLGYASGGALAALVFKMGHFHIGLVLGFISLCLAFVCLKQSKIMGHAHEQEIL